MAPERLAARPVKSPAKKVTLIAHVADAKEVVVTGDFSGWSEPGTPLTRGADGAWRAALKLAPGEYQYRLRVDGRWQDHDQAKKRVPNPFGTENCVLTVS